MRKIYLLLFSMVLICGFNPMQAQDTIVFENFNDTVLPYGWTANNPVRFKNRNICGGGYGLHLYTTGFQLVSGGLCADKFSYIKLDYGTFQVATSPPFAVTGEVRIRLSQDTNFNVGYIELPSTGVQFDTTTLCNQFSFRIDTFRAPPFGQSQSFNMSTYTGPLYVRISYSQGFPGDEHFIENFMIEGQKQTCAVTNSIDTPSINGTSATISWAAVNCAAGYLLDISSSTDCNYAGFKTTTTSTSQAITGLTAGKLYQATVYTLCTSGDTSVGEVFNFRTPSSCAVPGAFTNDGSTDATAAFSWTGASNAEMVYGAVGFDPCTAGTHAFVSGGAHTLTGLSASTSYEAYIRQVCGANDSSGWTDKLTFNTSATGFQDLFENFEAIRVYPMPADNFININVTPQSSQLNVSVVDLTGRVLISVDYDVSKGKQQTVTVDLENLSDGFYQLFFSSGGQTGSKPIIVAGK